MPTKGQLVVVIILLAVLVGELFAVVQRLNDIIVLLQNAHPGA